MDRQRTFSRAEFALAYSGALLGVLLIAWLAYKAGLPPWASTVLAAIGVVHVMYGLWRDPRLRGGASRSSGDATQGRIPPVADAADEPVGFVRALVVPPSRTTANGRRGAIARFLNPARDTPAAWVRVWAVWLLTLAGVGLVGQLTDPFDFRGLFGPLGPVLRLFAFVMIIWVVVSRWRGARRDE